MLFENVIHTSVTLLLCQIFLADHKWSTNQGHLKLYYIIDTTIDYITITKVRDKVLVN